MTDKQAQDTALEDDSQAVIDDAENEKDFLEGFGTVTAVQEAEEREEKREDSRAALEAAEKPKEETKAGEADEEAQEQAEEPDALDQLENRLSTRMRNLEGHLGGLKSQLQQMMTSAKADVTDEGTAAPTKAQIAEASQDREKLDELRDLYPEWADALDQEVSLLEGRLAGKVQQVDTNALREYAQQTAAQAAQEARQLGRLDAMAERRFEAGKWPTADWETTLGTDEWASWLESQDEETQNLAFSPKASESVKLMDKYYAHVMAAQKKEQELQAQQEKEQQQEKKEQEKRTRLASAVAPTRGAATRQAGPSEEDDFLAGFNEVAGSR